jgi:hypothetical protein
MFVTVPLMMMLAVAQAGDPVGAGRKAYSQCLISKLQPSVDARKTLAEFRTILKTACGDKEATFRAAILADDKANGMSDKDAQADADDQITGYVDNITSQFEDFSKDN